MARTQKGIEYPSDYSEIADIPEVMKEMAESIDEVLGNQDKKIENKVQKENGKGLSTNDYTNEEKTKLANLENYNDTEIKEDISNIEDDISSLNTDITKLNVNKADRTELPDVSDFITKDVDNLTNYTKSGDMTNAINTAVGIETTARQNADNNLQSQIDAITSASDVVDVVGTYTELQNYDTTKLTDKDLIKVLQDSTHNNALSYYRWVSNVWSYVGSEGPFYTKGEADTLYNAKQNTIDSSHKLQSDLVDDTNQTNKFTTANEKETWNGKYDKPNTGIPKTDLASDVQTSLGKADSALQHHQDISGKEDKSNKTTSINENSTDIQYPSAKAVYYKQKEISDELVITGQANGIAPTLEDSANYSFRNVDLGGNTEQGENPSPENPQEVENVGNNVNLLNISELNDTVAYGTGSSITFSNNGYTVTTGSEFRGDYFAFYVEKGKTYTLKFKAIGFANYRIYADNSGTTIIASSLASEIPYTFTATATQTLYVRFWANSGGTATLYYAKLEEGTQATAYTPYNRGGVDVKVQNKNLFDKNNPNIKNGYLNANGNVVSTSAYRVSDYIYLYDFEKITISGGHGDNEVYCFYNEDKSFNKAESMGNNITTKTITIPANAKYVRATLNKDVLDQFMIESGTTASNYVAHEEQNITLPLPEGMELCKIGDYQDKIFKNTKNSTMYNSELVEGAWYKYKAIGKVVLDGSEEWSSNTSLSGGRSQFFISVSGITPYSNHLTKSSHFIESASGIDNGIYINSSGSLLVITAPKYNGEYIVGDNNFKTWLSTNNVTVYYILATSTYEQITDTDFIEQAELMLKMKSYKDITYVSSDNEPSPYFDIVFLKDTILGNNNGEIYEELNKKGTAQVVNTESNSTQDSYSCDYVNNAVKEVYLTDEQVIGTWIDGKPLYRKVITVSSLPNTSEETYPNAIQNLENITNLYGVCSNGLVLNGARGTFTTSEIGCWYDMTDNAIKILTGSDRSTLSANIIVEYTKITDTANT